MIKYIRMLRLPFVFVSVTNCALLYFACGLKADYLLSLILAGTVVMHLAGNIWNAVFDHAAAAEQNAPAILSGGNNAAPDDNVLEKKPTVIAASLAVAAIGLYVLLSVVCFFNMKLLLLLLVAGALTVFYSTPPLRLSYHSMGELVVFFNYGPLLLYGVAFLLNINVSYGIFFIACALGVSAVLVLLVNEFSRREHDELMGKVTIVVFFGEKIAAMLVPVVASLLCIFVSLAADFYTSLAVAVIYIVFTFVFLSTQLRSIRLAAVHAAHIALVAVLYAGYVL